jgi:carbamoyl-phosphate synthase large subunit
LHLTKEEAETHAHKLEYPIFQPFIEGQEWSVDLFRSSRGIVIGCVARRRDFIVKGESQMTTTHVFPSLEELCKKVADFLDIQGHAIFQVIEDQAGTFHIIECNPRFGGASTASIAVGLDSFYWFFLECTGCVLSPYLFQRRLGEIRQVRYPTDRIIPW